MLTITSRRHRIFCVGLSVLSLVFIEVNRATGLIPPLVISSELHPVFRYSSVAAILFLIALILFLYEENTRRALDKADRALNSLSVSQSALEKKTQELASRSEELERMSVSKSVYVRETSHELRGPISAIYSMVQFLSSTTVQPSEAREYYRRLATASSMALDIINNVRELAAIESGREQPVRPSAVSIRPWLGDLMSVFDVLAAHRKLTILLDVHPDTPAQVVLDELKVKQVLTNLLTNAIKFSDTGADINVFVYGDVSSWSCSVCNSGASMSEEQMRVVFDQFFTTAENNPTGSGLGLHISKKLVQQMGGSICVRKTTTLGNCFYFSLPVLGINLDVPAQKPEAPNSLLPADVVIIEDDAMNAKLVENYLFSVGATAWVAENAVSGLALAESRRPDLVLLDLSLPDMNGLKAYELLRRSPVLRDTRIVAVTGSYFEEDRKAALAMGFDGYLTKPINFNDLKRLLLTAMGILNQ